MNNIKQKIKALKFARKQIASGKAEYVCHALDDYAYENLNNVAVVKELKVYISQSLTNSPNNYDSASLERWLEMNNYLPDSSVAWQGQGAKKIRQTRINWIDWMIACYEEDMLK